MSGVRDRFAGLDSWRVDGIFAIAITVELQLQSWLRHGVTEQQQLVTAVASVLVAAPIAVRRARPGVALVFCGSVVAIQTLLNGEILTDSLTAPDSVVPELVLLVLCYSAGAWLDSRRILLTLMLALALLVACAFMPGDGGPPTGLGSIASAILYQSLLIIPGWFIGRLARERSRRSTAFRELATQAATEQDAREAAAIAAERARIGGELQDIIAHSVSVMVIQAGGARLLLHGDPDRARDSILNVEHTGREVLADLRRLLGMLRKDDDPRALRPQPGLSQLTTLIDSIRQAGLECELPTVGNPIELTPGVDLVADRVIEVALLTAAEHRVSRGLVTIRYEPRELELEIAGDGGDPRP